MELSPGASDGCKAKPFFLSHTFKEHPPFRFEFPEIKKKKLRHLEPQGKKIKINKLQPISALERRAREREEGLKNVKVQPLPGTDPRCGVQSVLALKQKSLVQKWLSLA